VKSVGPRKSGANDTGHRAQGNRSLAIRRPGFAQLGRNYQTVTEMTSEWVPPVMPSGTENSCIRELDRLEREGFSREPKEGKTANEAIRDPNGGTSRRWEKGQEGNDKERSGSETVFPQGVADRKTLPERGKGKKVQGGICFMGPGLRRKTGCWPE